jgi:SAM-dependent methyltransferase
MTIDDEYVLGTHDEEIARLRLQHDVWRAHAQAAWQRAEFAPGQHIADIGSGPGFATLDLARLVGASGRVTAVDRSRRFLDVLAAAAPAQGIEIIQTVEADLDEPLPPSMEAIDGAWARWVFAFVRDPRMLLARIAERMRPQATIAIHEYFDYAAWRMMPPRDELNEFVHVVIRSWRKSGGEPDIASSLPRWLEELGFSIVHLRPIVDVTSPGEPAWEWLTAFIESGRKRLASIGELSPQRSNAIGAALRTWPSALPTLRMISPAVLEIVARR